LTTCFDCGGKELAIELLLNPILSKVAQSIPQTCSDDLVVTFQVLGG
jgi:hypothetical protein